MKNILLIVGLLGLITTSCVQKSYKRTVVFNLDTRTTKNVITVGICGENFPLSWNKDLKMKLDKDGIYKAKIIFETGYKFAEVKFTINGDFELKDMPNRKVVFATNGTTNYNAVYNVEKQ